MTITSMGSRPASALSAEDEARLLQFAPLFDITVVHLDDQDAELEVLDRTGTYRVRVHKEKLAVRLLAELCSKTSRWVYFQPGIACSHSLLSQTDARLKRLAQLYAKWKSEGFPA